ncbi:MAG: ribosome-associated translation inhibitor RaiA [Gemmatimonadota bacterium]|jgi:putative sigma-54 modulation protein|nr:ribosomal subunit interface protein [Gemmatimonadota bacterium]MDP6460953.1 ribosome-associated translation inhibitor RaiA [Gemmatimonadota bacterium]MDP6529946.1 ribosome-associated translation inhibitor RaiA [Gemmatimonadota bacterium]MDP6802276.1 ribosome-associated translation inhibitor RaiA [Gemmatimonadota bacterium]MDP7031990.1 ribosome-associated translation inhibitor RaiA [Gemmatimonadota bacterium]
MKTTITARHFDLSPELRDHVEGRLDRCEKFTDGLIKAHVVLVTEKYRHTAEVSIHARHGGFTGKAESDDMMVSVDLAVEKIERQIRKQADKMHDHNRGERAGVVPGMEANIPEDAGEAEDWEETAELD